MPLGRHSVHGVRFARPGRQTEQIEGLTSLLRALPERVRLLECWRLGQVQELWVAANLGPDRETVLEGFEAVARPLRKPPEDLVSGLLEHLTVPL